MGKALEDDMVRISRDRAGMGSSMRQKSEGVVAYERGDSLTSYGAGCTIDQQDFKFARVDVYVELESEDEADQAALVQSVRELVAREEDSVRHQNRQAKPFALDDVSVPLLRLRLTYGMTRPTARKYESNRGDVSLQSRQRAGETFSQLVARVQAVVERLIGEEERLMSKPIGR